MECKFHVGQKVVLARMAKNAEGHRKFSESRGYAVTYPELGRIYTVREIFLHETGAVAMRLVEIVNPVVQYKNGEKELCFDAANFRPIVERKTDISIFKAMLTPKTEQVPA